MAAPRPRDRTAVRPEVVGPPGGRRGRAPPPRHVRRAPRPPEGLGDLGLALGDGLDHVRQRVGGRDREGTRGARGAEGVRRLRDVPLRRRIRDVPSRPGPLRRGRPRRVAPRRPPAPPPAWWPPPPPPPEGPPG